VARSYPSGTSVAGPDQIEERLLVHVAPVQSVISDTQILSWTTRPGDLHEAVDRHDDPTLTHGAITLNEF
jgi:hypothetical protein